MSLPFTAKDITQNIGHDTQACEKLLSILHEEQEALKHRDADTMERLLAQKGPIIERLENSAKLRHAWATAANVPSSEDGWMAMLTELGAGNIKSAWDNLKALYAKVHEQNEVNGKLLSRHQSTINRLLDVMRGRTASANLYNASGYAATQANSNKFGEA